MFGFFKLSTIKSGQFLKIKTSFIISNISSNNLTKSLPPDSILSTKFKILDKLPSESIIKKSQISVKDKIPLIS